MTAWLLMVVLAAEAERPATYTVQAGDTCESVTRRFWGQGAKVQLLHAWNVLGPVPHKLVPGQVLRLREPDANAPDATLTFVKPAVRARTSGAWEPAKLGMGLFRLDEVNTLRRAGAELTLRDESQLLLDENALVVIYGEPNSQRVSRGPAIIEGDVRLALKGARGVELANGATVSSLRAEGVASVDGARTGRVSIFDGDVVVESQRVAVKLSKDQGTVVRSGAAPLPARPLPQPPQLENVPPLLVAGRDGVATLTLRWPAVQHAARYRVQLAREERYLDIAAVVETTAPEASVVNVPPGRYCLRVIAFDAEGLQGRGSPHLDVAVVALGAGADARGVVPLSAGEQPRFVGPPGYTLADIRAPLPVGRHQLDVRDEKGEPVAKVPVSVRPSAPRVRVVAGRVELRFTEPLSSSDGLAISDAQGAVAATQRDANTIVTERPVSGPTTVSWDGFDLLRFGR